MRSDILFRKIGIRSGILFQKIGIRNGYVVEALMARPRRKSGQVHPPGPGYQSQKIIKRKNKGGNKVRVMVLFFLFPIFLSFKL